MSIPEDDPMTGLEERIALLERLVYGGPSAPPPAIKSASDSLLAKFKAIQQKIQQLEKQFPQIFESVSTIVSVEQALPHLIPLSAQAKYQLLTTQEDALREAEKQATAVNSNTEHINPAYLKHLGDIKKELASRQAVHAEQLEDASVANQRFLALVKEQQDIINLLSKKFAFWDFALREADKKLTAPV